MQHKNAEFARLVWCAQGRRDSISVMQAINLQPTTWQRLLCLSGLLVGFALRLFHLGSASLWYDETVSVVLARKALPALIAHTAGDIHPPGYYLLLHGWQWLVQPTLAHGLEFLFAWPSLFFGLLIVALLFALGRKLLDPTTALIGLWLAAINPFHIWYSQEVRMYTLGAWLGLLCLWAVLKWCEQQRAVHWGGRWLALYAVAGALGLYSLYYFLFVIITLNVMVLCNLGLARQHRGQPFLRGFGQWLLAQVALLILWSPWLGIFWRQATDPPVPPWRVAWGTFAELSAALSESVSALLMGQSAPNPGSTRWLLVVGSLLLLAALGYANKKSQRPGFSLLCCYTFLPLALLYLITYFVTPLYHVRYLFTYAPPFLLLVAAAMTAVGRRHRALGAVGLLALLAVNGLSLQRFWFDARYQSDDHRAAVAQLAQAWRPGDLILVNAGWVYTALETYWPTVPVGVDAALPPPLAKVARLHDYAQEVAAMPSAPNQQPVVVRSGSINGPATLGWGDPQSDFFAIDSLTTAAALLTLSQHYGRLWHYRLYDTVSDPKGQIRTWLETNGEQQLDQAMPGRDYLALQLYRTKSAATVAPVPLPVANGQAIFGDTLQLTAAAISPQPIAAGSTLYLQSHWVRLPTTTPLPPIVSVSLRLSDDQGLLLAQQDETPLQPPSAWPLHQPTAWGLALPLPSATPPGTYQLQLVVYAQATGQPLLLGQGASSLTVGEIEVINATTVPEIKQRLARFDYIDLVQVNLPAATTVAAGLRVTLFWLPQPNAYRDTYLARLLLRDRNGNLVQAWTDALGGWRYPSGTWPPSQPVRHDQQLALDPTIPPGSYTVTLQVQRQSDGTHLPAVSGWWQQTAELVLGTVAVE